MFEGEGAEAGIEHRINVTTDFYQWEPVVDWQGDQLILAWSSWGQDGDDYGIFARHFTTTSVDVEDAGIISPKTYLTQNFPNPVTESTRIQYWLEKPARVQIEVFDLLGRRVKSLVDQHQSQGVHEVSWNGLDDAGGVLAAGLYLYRLSSDAVVETRHLVLLGK